MYFSNYISEKKSFRNEAFKIRTAAELQAERIRKEAAELAAKVDDDYRGGDYAAADDDDDHCKIVTGGGDSKAGASWGRAKDWSGRGDPDVHDDVDGDGDNDGDNDDNDDDDFYEMFLTIFQETLLMFSNF